jgi:hypothetical protein
MYINNITDSIIAMNLWKIAQYCQTLAFILILKSSFSYNMEHQCGVLATQTGVGINTAFAHESPLSM